MGISSKIQKQVSIKGDIEFDRDLLFDGKLEGDIRSSGNLTIGQNGLVKGKINAKTVTVFGKVEGNMTIDNTCAIEKNASVWGDIKSQTLRLEEGAVFNGFAEITPQAEPQKEEHTPEDWMAPEEVKSTEEALTDK